MRKFINQLIASAVVLAALAAPVVAQETTGTIVGNLVDEIGAVLPGVQVVITNANTGQTREVTTNGAGRYIAILPIGDYEITFRLAGFQSVTVRGVSLHLNDRLPINGKLSSGTAEALTVTAEPLVQPTSAVQSLIHPTAVRELPLVNRSLVPLAALVPGVSNDLLDEVPFGLVDNLRLSINGSRASAINWLLDGASNVDVGSNLTLLVMPSLESIQEINVLTSNYTAEWPRSGGGIVNVVTKSGTSTFSGSAYEFFRHDKLNANSFFRNLSKDPAINSSPPRLRYNNFGYTIGGPGLPSRKKLFFFLSEEWRRQSTGRLSIEAIVPDPVWLTDPSDLRYVPPEERDPNAVKLLAAWPAPNVPGTNLFRATYRNPDDTRQEVVRVDYGLSPRWMFTGRHTHDLNETFQPRGFRDPQALQVSTGTILNAATDTDASASLSAAQLRTVIGRWLNEFSYHRSGNRLSTTSLKGTKNTRDGVGITIPELFAENRANLIPDLWVNGLTPVASAQPFDIKYLNHSVTDNLTLHRGRHTFKTGSFVALEEKTESTFSGYWNTQGRFRFWGRNDDESFRDFLRGNAGDYWEADVQLRNDFRFSRYEIYAQDTWAVRPNVTLDLGIRYSLYSPVKDKNNVLTTFSPEAYDPAKCDPLQGCDPLNNPVRIAGRNSPYGRAIYPWDKNNIQPRLGVSWSPRSSPRTLVRGGYGVYFNQPLVGIFRVQPDHPAFMQSVRVSRPGLRLSDPSVSDGPSTRYSTLRTVLATSESFETPRTQHWNLGIHWQPYRRGAIDVDYVGSRGDHLIRPVNINQADGVACWYWACSRPYQHYGDILMRETTGRNRYHGLLARIHHEGGRAGSLTVNYALSRNRADATSDNVVFSLYSYLSPDPPAGPGQVRFANVRTDLPENSLDKDAEFGDAWTDRRHIFTAYYVYELPFFRDAPGGFPKRVLGGWQVAGITTINSGPAARVIAGHEEVAVPFRLNLVGDPGAGRQGGLLWFNTKAFEPPAFGAHGTPVAPFRLPGRHQWDFALSKNLSFAGRARLQLRADFINAFNHTQFLDVNTLIPGGIFVTSCSEGPRSGCVFSTRAPRQIQLGLRLSW